MRCICLPALLVLSVAQAESAQPPSSPWRTQFAQAEYPQPATRVVPKMLDSKLGRGELSSPSWVFPASLILVIQVQSKYGNTWY